MITPYYLITQTQFTLFSKRKKISVKIETFYVFVDLSNAWLNKRKLSSHTCFCSFCCLCCFGWESQPTNVCYAETNTPKKPEIIPLV